MKRIAILTLTAGAIAVAGIGIGVHKAESAGHGGDSYRGSHSGGGWGKHGGGKKRWGRGHHRGHGMRHMMKRFDTDKDGKLTQDEINSARTALVTKHDADGNGQLTLAEFQNLWLEVRRKRMVRSFQRIDEDGDAIISVEEFLEPYARIVERMDRNEDGVLDKADRKRGRGWRHKRRHGGERNKPEGEQTEQ